MGKRSFEAIDASNKKIADFKKAIISVDRWTLNGCYNFLKEESQLKKLMLVARYDSFNSNTIVTVPFVHSSSPMARWNAQASCQTSAETGASRPVVDPASTTVKAVLRQRTDSSEISNEKKKAP